MVGAWVAVAGAIAVAVAIAVLYNRLVALRTEADRSWADVDVQLRRRHDLIGNLVETVRGYAAHEREVLERVTAARARAVGAGGVREQAEAEADLTAALRSLFAVAEGYPQLQASANFADLQEELTATEDRVAAARSDYNGAVRRYETARGQVPTNLIAVWFSFPAREYFEVEDPEARDPVRVEF